MNQNDKFDMLSVVAFGIHTKVRRMLEEEVAKATAEADLRDVLRPFFFYEYFLDPPVVLGEDPTPAVAYAPFLGRLAAQSEFMPVPFLGGYKAAKGITPQELKELSKALLVEGDLRVPATRSNINTYWSEHVVFEDAITKSDVLRLLYRFWRDVELSLPLQGTRAQVRQAIEQCQAELEDDDKKPYVEISQDFADYSEGIVSISAGWARLFAAEGFKNLLVRYASESIESALREFFTCIYPWLRNPAYLRRPAEAKDRLFELLTCSISSRRVFFGELILIYPPIGNPELRARAGKRLRSVLHKAAVDLYVPMLTLYENYAGETDLKREVFPELAPHKQDSADADKTKWKDSLSPRFEARRWAALQPFLSEIGRVGASQTRMSAWPDVIADTEFLDPAANPFFRIIQFIPPETVALESALKKLRRALDVGGDPAELLKEVQERGSALAKCLDTEDERVGVAAWSQAFMPYCEKIASWKAGVANAEVERLRRGLLNDCRRATSVLSDMEIALAQLWAHRLAVMHDEPWAVEESLVFEEYLIASPGMVRCIREAMHISHTLSTTPKKRRVQTALVVGGPGSGKDSMARLVRVFSPGYRFGKQSTLNMGMFRPKELAVPFLLGIGATLESGVKPDRAPFGLVGVLKQAQLDPVGGSAALGEQGYSFILDELNSLDIDTQGALLRVFENSELVPLGSMTKDKIAFLFVGVMNEDPELIMKKRALDGILRDQTLFGGLVGETLYEMFRNQRRLRDDLYYRLARGGEIRIPDLRERREDLPILTYFIVREFLKEISLEGRIELAVYEELLDPALTWPGNVRELQALCRRVVDAALADNQLAPDGRLEILRSHALRALGRVN
ncbi:sigma 54-interacting transcriptional regulator [bacterium]|nr:sigma 54-interacting transcriptional regulator [bacterium]